MTEYTDEHPTSIHPAAQFPILLMLTVAGAVAFAAVGFALVYVFFGASTLSAMRDFSATSPPAVLNALKLFQSLSSIFLFLVPAVFFGWVVVHEPKSYLKVNTHFPIVLLLLVFVIMLASSPFLEWVVNLNQKMVFPNFLKGIYKWMRESEDEAARETDILLKMKTTGDLLVNMLMIAVLPAICEEFMFRGAIQTIFTRWTKNPHWGIWIAAILFSAMHLQFFGFLPRMLLGVGFGYFVWWSGSIWTSVWGHFLNNGTAVVVTYLYQQKKIPLNPDDSHVFNYYGLYAFSLIITVLLFLVYRQVTETKKILPEL
jgi:membrane protease YdiL (CAAX protease family)